MADGTIDKKRSAAPDKYRNDRKDRKKAVLFRLHMSTNRQQINEARKKRKKSIVKTEKNIAKASKDLRKRKVRKNRATKVIHTAGHTAIWNDKLAR
jgi:hypothetical protein